MKSSRFFALLLVSAIFTFLLGSCVKENVPDYREHDYGYVQFKLYKDASYPGTKAAPLDYLHDVAKLKVTLRYEDNLISQTMVMSASSDEAAEFGLRSAKLKLLAGDYQVVTFTLYDKLDKVVSEGTPDESSASFNVVAGGLHVHDLVTSVVERGKVRFTMVKDFSDFAETKAAVKEYTFDEIKYVTVSVKTSNTTSVFEMLPADFSVHFNEDDDVEDGYMTSSLSCDSLITLRAGNYTIES